jgi:hypothetical protein
MRFNLTFDAYAFCNFSPPFLLFGHRRIMKTMKSLLLLVSSKGGCEQFSGPLVFVDFQSVYLLSIFAANIIGPLFAEKKRRLGCPSRRHSHDLFHMRWSMMGVRRAQVHTVPKCHLMIYRTAENGWTERTIGDIAPAKMPFVFGDFGAAKPFLY